MRVSFLLFALFWFASAASANDGLELKGLMLGGEVTTAQVEQSLATPCEQFGKPCDETWKGIHDHMKVSCGDGSDGVKVCNGMTTIAGVSADANVVIGSDGRLQRIFLTVGSDSFDVIADELSKKFGRPSTVKHSVVQNGFGATYAQVEFVWQRVNGLSVLLTKYASDVDHSTIYFSTKQDRQLMSGSGADSKHSEDM